MSTLTFIPVGKEEIERLFKPFEPGDFFDLKKVTTGLVYIMSPYIGLNNEVLFKEKDTTLSLVQLPNEVESQLDELIKTCGIVVRTMTFLQKFFVKNESKNRILVLSQPAKTSWIYMGHVDWDKIFNYPVIQRQLIADFEQFLENRKSAGFIKED